MLEPSCGSCPAAQGIPRKPHTLGCVLGVTLCPWVYGSHRLTLSVSSMALALLTLSGNYSSLGSNSPTQGSEAHQDQADHEEPRQETHTYPLHTAHSISFKRQNTTNPRYAEQYLAFNKHEVSQLTVKYILYGHGVSTGHTGYSSTVPVPALRMQRYRNRHGLRPAQRAHC